MLFVHGLRELARARALARAVLVVPDPWRPTAEAPWPAPGCRCPATWPPAGDHRTASAWHALRGALARLPSTRGPTRRPGWRSTTPPAPSPPATCSTGWPGRRPATARRCRRYRCPTPSSSSTPTGRRDRGDPRGRVPGAGAPGGGADAPGLPLAGPARRPRGWAATPSSAASPMTADSWPNGGCGPWWSWASAATGRSPPRTTGSGRPRCCAANPWCSVV